MIVRLDKEQAKQERRRLLGDTVYVIFHDALKAWQKDGRTTLSPVELFLSAKGFSKLLMELPDVMEGIDDEMDDLVDETENENDAMIIMMLASGILHAVGKHRVGFDAKPVIMAIYARWSDHPLFIPFMDEGCKKEQARWLEGKRTNLLTYELEEIGRDGEGEEKITELFMSLVEMSDKMDEDTIKGQLLFLNRYNIDHGNRYNKQIIALYEKLGIKSTTLLSVEEMVLKKSVDKQAIVNTPGGIGFEVKE